MSQINFFMLQEDVAEFCNHICGLNSVSLIEGKSFSTQTPKVLKVGESLKFGSDGTIVCHPEEELYPPLSERVDDKINTWYYNMNEDCIIDFDSPTLHENGVLVAGRIFSKHSHSPVTTLDKYYTSTYRNLQRWIKKHYTKIGSVWWVSNRVRSWSLNGGELGFGHHSSSVVRQLTNEDFE